MNSKSVLLDTTYLHYGADMRGIPQVIFQLVRLVLETADFSSFRFIATKKAANEFLLRLGVPENRIETVPALPFFSHDIRFHGFFCNARYRAIKKHAACIIHPEYRTVISAHIPQLVIFHDFFP